MFLVDTSVFLEILLGQNRKEECKRFLSENIKNLNITDFSLHSLGIILFRYKRGDIFQRFSADILSNVKLLSLPIKLYGEITNVHRNIKLDFDDAYQYSIAKHYGLRIVTLDKDFENVKDVEILFL